MSVKGDVVNRSVAVTPHDSTNLAEIADGVCATGPGTCTVVFEDNSTMQYTLAVGVPLMDIRFKRVNSTGTGATGIKALYYLR